MEKNQLKHLAVLAAIGIGAGSCQVQQKSAPNIIFIMSDDHASRAISCYGDSLIHTPAIDQLAEDGVRFTNACVSNSISAPCRATILTGKHSHLNGLMTNDHVFDGSQQTFPKLLQQAGYETALIGKWHLKSTPTGFDHWQILPGQGDYYNPVFIDSTGAEKHDGYVTELITKFSLDWLKRNSDKPFCLLMQHKAPHRNWMPSQEFLNEFDDVKFPLPETFYDDYEVKSSASALSEMRIDRDLTPVYDLKLSTGKIEDDFIGKGEYPLHKRMTQAEGQTWVDAYQEENDAFFAANLKGKELAEWKYQRYLHDYLATIKSVDQSVNALVSYLKQNDLYDNTIVVYTSDQGFYLGEHGWFDKRFMYEESLHTPLIIHYPESMSKGEVSEALVQNLDFAPTFLDLLGLPIPADMQGVSFKETLENPAKSVRDDVYYHYYEFPGEHAVRRHYGIRTDRYKLIHFYHDIDAWEFYDLEKDPVEVHNLYEQKEYQVLIDSLKERLAALQMEYMVPDSSEELAPAIEIVDNLARDKTIKFAIQPSSKYAGGKNVLTDGIIRKFDQWHPSGLGHFQAFAGDDLDVLIDLGELKWIDYIKARFLDFKGPWIFPPSEVIIEISEDGKTYIPFNNESKIISSYYDRIILSFESSVNSNARYIRIFAKNYGYLPEDHPGAGNKSWLFADEIIIN